MSRTWPVRQPWLIVTLLAVLLAAPACRRKAQRPPRPKPVAARADGQSADGLAPAAHVAARSTSSADASPVAAAVPDSSTTESPKSDAATPAASTDRAAADKEDTGVPVFPIAERWWVSGSERPARIAWRLGANGKPVETAWDEYLQATAGAFDADQDGRIRWSEVLANPDVRRGAYGNPAAATDRDAYQLEQQYDVDGDQLADTEEMSRFLLANSGLSSPVTVQADVRNSQLRYLGGTLFELLDRDQDHALRDDECGKIFRRLCQLDVDGDWALTSAEAQLVAPETDDPISRTQFDERVVMRLNRRSTPGDVIYWLQQIYGLSVIGEGGITTQSQQQALSAPAGLSSPESSLEEWESELTVSVAFSDDGPPQVKLVPATPEETVIRVVQDGSSSGSWKLEIGGMPVAIEVHDAWSEWTRRMKADELIARLDKDANGQLGREELAAEGLEMLVAGQEDASATLSTDDLPAAIARLADARRATVRMDVSPARDIWIGLDQNGDGRLGEREMQQAQQVVMQQDHGGDGAVRAEEIIRGLVIRITRPAPAVVARPADRTPAMPSVKDDDTSSAWFGAMDLNQDGEISAREFPGARETFKTLDTDGDGFIEPSEVPVTEETA